MRKATFFLFAILFSNSVFCEDKDSFFAVDFNFVREGNVFNTDRLNTVMPLSSNNSLPWTQSFTMIGTDILPPSISWRSEHINLGLNVTSISNIVELDSLQFYAEGSKHFFLAGLGGVYEKESVKDAGESKGIPFGFKRKTYLGKLWFGGKMGEYTKAYVLIRLYPYGYGEMRGWRAFEGNIQTPVYQDLLNFKGLDLEIRYDIFRTLGPIKIVPMVKMSASRYSRRKKVDEDIFGPNKFDSDYFEYSLEVIYPKEDLVRLFLKYYNNLSDDSASLLNYQPDGFTVNVRIVF